MGRYAAAFIGLAVLTLWPDTATACCRYGCCDCSCIALQMQEKAPSIAIAIERALQGKNKGGSIQSFKIDLSDRPISQAKWSCAPIPNGAICTRPSADAN